MIEVKVVAHSIAPCGAKLVSVQCTYPRIIHSELMTHRRFSRCAASSRAIPIEKMVQRVMTDPAMPVSWGLNQKGMQSTTLADDEIVALGQDEWWAAAQDAVRHSRRLAALGFHKQICNRLTEPFQHMVTLVSSTEWNNFFHLRYHKAADPTFQALAKAIYEAMEASEPAELRAGDWHLPYVTLEDHLEAMDGTANGPIETLKKVSTGRCARTSYLNQEGKRSLADDVGLHDRLLGAAAGGDPGHFSPFEHVAKALDELRPSGNFVGFEQYRKSFSFENMTDLFSPKI